MGRGGCWCESLRKSLIWHWFREQAGLEPDQLVTLLSWGLRRWRCSLGLLI